jgi:hypothetical protein
MNGDRSSVKNILILYRNILKVANKFPSIKRQNLVSEIKNCDNIYIYIYISYIYFICFNLLLILVNFEHFKHLESIQPKLVI